MRKVVCNTTPILSLLKIEKLALLQALYSSVTIPEAVWREVEAGKEGHIPLVKPLLELLRQNGVWIHDRFFQDVLLLAGE